MRQSLAHLALIVRDYNEAITWFTDKLAFRVIADEHQAEQDKRWVVIAPPGAHDGATTLLLARAATPGQERFIGNQSGGRVFLFLRTDDFTRDYDAMRAKGVRFVREPKSEPYGTVAVFEDLYGNRWDLVQLAASTSALTINRGDLFWLDADESRGPYAHPHVIVSDDIFNHSRVTTVVVCALTSNLHRATEPGNVLLEVGEGELPKQSVVVVSQIDSVEKTRLRERIGSLSEGRVQQIVDGLRFQQRSFFRGQ